MITIMQGGLAEMGAKLSGSKYMDSIGALRQLFIACNRNHGPMTLKVEVIDGRTGNIDFELLVKTTITFDNMDQKISLIWEECGFKNYRSLGLFGVYWTLYNEMDFDEDESSLTIRSSDSDKLVRIFV